MISSLVNRTIILMIEEILVDSLITSSAIAIHVHSIPTVLKQQQVANVYLPLENNN